MTDLINALFELGAAIFLSLDIQALRKDKRVAGISITSRLFFLIYSLFSPYFFAIQGLIWSTIGAGALALVSLAWFVLYLKIKYEEKKEGRGAQQAAQAWDDWRDSLACKQSETKDWDEATKLERLRVGYEEPVPKRTEPDDYWMRKYDQNKGN